MKIRTYIFSYNRGKSLLNLIESAKTNWKYPITIFDDCSTDSTTISILEKLKVEGYEIIYSYKKVGAQLGGLYQNMSRVLEECKDEFVMFLQDDTQFVRVVEESEISRICEILSSEKSPFLFQCFFTTTWSITTRLRLKQSCDVYQIDPHYPYGGASDVCIFNCNRLKLDGWSQFLNEEETDRLACHLYGSMTVLANPFIAFIPFPHIPRKNIIKRIISSRGVSGLVNFNIMSSEEINTFKSRSKTSLPIDLDYLTPKGGIMFRFIKLFFGVRY